MELLVMICHTHSPQYQNDPEDIVLHCDTNDLRQNFSAVEIGQKILELASSCKSDSNNILVSGIVQHRGKLNAKAAQVNSFLKNTCSKRNICFVNNSNINPTYHCNQSGIHLNKSGSNRLTENLLFALSKFDC